MKLIIALLFIQTLFIGCRPDQEVTEFNVLIGVPVGDDLSLEVEEDTDLIVNYTLQEGDYSVDLKMNITKHPQNGLVKKCEYKSNVELECIYSPNKDFSGMDYFEITTQDGDIKAEKSSKVSIKVIEISDAPKALDDSLNVEANTLLNFQLPEGIDADSLSSELTYELLDSPSNGVLSNCVNKVCSYTSQQFFDGVEVLTYKITDEKGLVSNIGTITINVNSSVDKATETFTQGVSNLSGVDIVWVIDNSGSMNDNQQTLKENFSSFIDNFLIDGKAKFPFNMAVTTTDIYDKAVGTNPFETNDSGNIYDLSSTRAEADFVSFKADFEEAVLVGVRGSGNERAYSSIDSAYNNMPGWYGDDKKMLAYILLSDESEHSGGDPALRVEAIQQLKSDKDRVKIFPIVGPDASDRYKAAADMTGTKLYDINSSFQTILDDISLTVSLGVSSFNLNPLANILAGTVVVTVGGIPTTDFTYANNTVTLSSPPAPYVTVVVTYEYGTL